MDHSLCVIFSYILYMYALWQGQFTDKVKKILEDINFGGASMHFFERKKAVQHGSYLKPNQYKEFKMGKVMLDLLKDDEFRPMRA